ncbi:DUF5134 domain-containing protein [Mycobacterium sp. Marseille-P9652]|uniref:DUF5134 domain-containing protein n=1 Tax=Mycobacterium sp. Marseille-P9652 TaxID=2654950 RepID=UPI001E4B65A6|nr:DUF5134 domain-containing protein [Mycobacterium sp. Marseille-P9652]
MSSGLMGDVAMRWVVTILFAASTTTYVYILVAQRARWTSTANHLLHLVMSVAMILMAWGVGMSLPTAAPMIFFLLSGLWFGHAASRTSTTAGDRLTNGYYAVMMAAMAWMFAVMSGGLAGQIARTSDQAEPAAAAMDMSGAEMPAHETFSAEPATGWIAAVNWIAALGFAVATLYWACRHLAKRRTIAVPHAAQLARLEPLHQVCSAAGTALMFGALL